MIYNILEFGAAALFWWCCYRVWTAEDKDIEEAFKAGAEWMQSELIEKAVEWFKHQKEEIGISWFDDFEIRFRKAMEE